MTSTLDRPYTAPVGFACARCTHYIEPRSKFCGNCGEVALLNVNSPMELQRAWQEAQIASNMANMEAARQRQGQAMTAPHFAVPKRKAKQIPQALRDEMSTIQVSMVRERFFLIFHYCVFVVSNLIGLGMAIKCYSEYIGDDVTKMMVASTPLLFINLCALCCLVPIKGTKGEIARLKDRMTNIKLRLEFDSVI